MESPISWIRGDRSKAKLLLFVKNLTAQLKALEDHLYAHDCLETFYIVQPVDVEKSSKVLPQTFNLMEDFALLHPQTISNSNLVPCLGHRPRINRAEHACDYQTATQEHQTEALYEGTGIP